MLQELLLFTCQFIQAGQIYQSVEREIELFMHYGNHCGTLLARNVYNPITQGASILC